MPFLAWIEALILAAAAAVESQQAYARSTAYVQTSYSSSIAATGALQACRRLCLVLRCSWAAASTVDRRARASVEARRALGLWFRLIKPGPLARGFIVCHYGYAVMDVLGG